MDAKHAIDTLRGGLWHTTSECRIQGIMSRKAILSDPPIPEDKRCGTRWGPDGWQLYSGLGGKLQIGIWQNAVEYAAFSEIVEWLSQGAPDPILGNQTVSRAALRKIRQESRKDGIEPEQMAALLVESEVFASHPQK